MTNYARSTTATFTQSFLNQAGNPLVASGSNYPTVQIQDPTSQIVASGVGTSTGTPGYYTWSWAIPVDATLGMGWVIRWDFLDANQDNTEKRVTFALVDQIETPDGLDRTAGYLSMKGYSERLIWKNATNPISVQVTLKDTAGDDTWTKTYAASDLSYVYADGYHVYYYDTTASTDHADEGQYLAVWRYQVSASNPFNNEVQWLVVPYDDFWYMLPHMKMLVDKLNKVTTTPLSYLDLELWQAMHNGLGFLNAIHPFTTWAFNTVPSDFYVWWFLAAGLFLLNSRQLLEIEVSHSLCLTGDTLISTPHGLLPLETVVDSARTCPCCGENNHGILHKEGLLAGEALVYDGAGRKQKTKATYYKKEAHTYKVETTHGYFLKGTRKHKVLAIGPDLLVKWVPIGLLTNEYWVAVASDEQRAKSQKYDFSLDEMCARRHSNRNSPNRLPNRMTPELARILGYFVSEGTCSPTFSISFSNADSRLHDDIRKCMTSEFGIRHIDDRHQHNLAYNTRFGSTVTRDYLARVGLDYVKSGEKCIPWSIMTAPLAIAKHFIRAYYDGDGSIDALSATSKSRQLIDQLQILLARFGILSKIKPHSNPKGIYWTLVVPASHYQRYANRVGFGFKIVRPVEGIRGSHLNRAPYSREILSHLRAQSYAPGYYLIDGEICRLRTKDEKESGNHDLTPDRLKIYLEKYGKTYERINARLYQSLVYLSSYNWTRVTQVVPNGVEEVFDLKLHGGPNLLDHSYIANGLIVHNSGNTTSLEYDHSSPLADVLSRWESMLWDKLPPAKLSAYRQSAGPGCIAVRPLRLDYSSRVYRVGSSSNAVSNFPELLNRLALF